MEVFVLMADYDGEALLGVYETEHAAHVAAGEWRPGVPFENYFPYVTRVKLGAAAEMRFWREDRQASVDRH